MARTKKSRKIGQIGTPKTQKHVAKDKSQVKNKKGNPAGSRQQTEETKSKSAHTKKSKDPRHGSKKPVSLVPQSSIKRFANPTEELAAIEADGRLASLLDKVEQGQTLRKSQQLYVDEKLNRHKTLCSLLGLDENDTDSAGNSDPLANLDAISLDDYIDPENS